MDLHTLHVEHALLLGLLTILTLINCRLHRGVRGMYWFPVYTLFALIGSIFIALRGHIADPLSIVAGMTFFHLAYLCLHRCLDEFFDRRSMRWSMPLQIVCVCVSFAVLLQYGAISPQTSRRLIVYSLVFALQLGLTAWLTFRNARGHLRAPAAMMAAILTVLALNNLVRALTTILAGAPANYLLGGPTLQWALATTSVLQAGITVSFVWMTAAMLHEDLRLLATTDSLTGLLNRRAMEAAARKEMAQSLQRGLPLAAILVDLDHFKAINDSFGHRFGDLTLVQVGQILRENMRSTDLLGRIGGDEFAIVLQNTDGEMAWSIAERLRHSLESLQVGEEERKAAVSASVGLAMLDPTISSWEELVSQCDGALYAVKGAGGNQVLSP